MASLYLLIPVSLIFCALAVAIFFWAVNSGQYDDLDGEGARLLFSDDSLEDSSDPPDTESSDGENIGKEDPEAENEHRLGG
jgi:cbb3-type cytochrome oxidase maturation protein